jgi:hypothetical protein
MRRGQVRRHHDAGHPQLFHAAAQLAHRLDRILEREHGHRVETPLVRLRIVVDVVVVGAAQRDGELAVDQRVERERHRPVDHLVVDALAIHVLDPNAVEEPADRRLAVIGPVGALAVSLDLQEHALEVGRARGGIEVADAEALLAVAIAQNRHAMAEPARDVVEEDRRVLALVAVRIDDGATVDHGWHPSSPRVSPLAAFGLREQRTRGREAGSSAGRWTNARRK